MKPLIASLCFVMVISIESGFAQASTSDSLNNKKTIRITPYQADTDVNAIGGFAVITKDSLAFQNYAGQSVLNTLRGHVPNFAPGQNSISITPALRNVGPMLIIDGLPFNSRISPYTNLRSFDYQNIYAISGGSATPFGGIASNGAIFLESKSGKGFDKPTVEFNTAPTFTWAGGGSEVRYDQWYITNSIAYQQDFGKADTRVSYSYTHLPASDDYIYDSRSNYHNLKINTGFDVTDRFNIRLIIDENRLVNKYESAQIQWNTERIEYENTRKVNSLQGNLMLRYQVRDWLLLSSQSSLAKIGDLNKSTLSSIPETSGDVERKFANMFASANLPLTNKFYVNAFAGVQLEKQEGDWRQFISSQTLVAGNWSTMESNTRTFSGGIGIQYYNSFFVNYNYRLDRFNELADNNNIEPTYSVTSSFVFSDAFKMSNRWFSSGKLRGSFGKAFYIEGQSYPFADMSQSLNLPNGYPSTLFRPMDRRNNEVGLDLAFFNNRLSVQATNFYEVNEKSWAVLPLPGGMNGYQYFVFDLGELRTKGWEFVLGTTPIARRDLAMNTKFIIGTYDTKIKSGQQSGGVEPQVIGSYNPNPDWRGSILNQLIWKKLYFTFLVDITRGGGVVTITQQNLKIDDGSFTMLRDVSLGLNLTPNAFIRNVNLSLSGRNLWLMYSKTSSTVETRPTRQKGISLNAALTF